MADPLTDLTVILEDHPGTLATAASALGKAGVNIEGIYGFGAEGGKAVGHILVEDADKARQALEGAGTQVGEEHEVLVVDVPNRPGELGKLARKIGDAGVNITTIYIATNNQVVIGADNLEKARAAVGQAAGARR